MKVKRIDINIPRVRNQHVPYLYNKALDFTNMVRVGGTFSNDGIKLSGVPVEFLRLLNKAKIYFNKVKK